MLVDTHCHLSMLINKEDIQTLSHADYQAVADIIHQAREHNVTHLMTISTTLASVYDNITYAQAFDAVSCAAGLHPCDYGHNWRQEISYIRQLLDDPHYAGYISAIGECGLDFHHPGYDAEEQKAVFQEQIELALSYDLPIVVHSRKATQEALRVIEPYIQDGIRGVIHCYGGDASLAKDICNRFGFYVGIAGPITYPKNDGLRDAVAQIGLEHILLETDAPFLPPQKIRGKKNHPLYVQTIAQEVARVLDLPENHIVEVTSNNASHLFDITTTSS